MTGPALPPGQRAVPLRRFGMPQFTGWQPSGPPEPVLAVGGRVRRPARFSFAELAAEVARREQRSDLHCVTTWSATDLRWSGLPFAAVYELVARQVGPDPDGRWLLCTGLDGFQCCLALGDALDDRVLLADRLDGRPLPVDHGAPLRLVAPAQYGYKNVKHLCAVELRRNYRPGSAGWVEHPRARVAAEERGPGLPGWAYRLPWRATVPVVRRTVDRQRRQAAVGVGTHRG